MLKAVFAFAALAMLASCATAQPQPQPQRWTGIDDFHFETVSFRPEGIDQNWWVVGANAEAQQALNTAIRSHTDNGGPWGRAQITIEGELSAPGHYGHLAAYDHEIHVTRVISATDAPRP